MAENTISEKTRQQLEKLAKVIIEIKKSLRIGTKSLTPLNYMEEMEKFFKSVTYNPLYIYKVQDLPNFTEKINALKLQVDTITIPKDLKEYILDYLDDLYNLYLTKSSIGKNDFSKNAHDLFDWGTDKLDLLLSKTPDVEFKMFMKHKIRDAKEIKKRFEKVLSLYNITSFNIEIDYFSPHIINVGYKNIGIGCEIRRFECNVDRLVVHEIESHVLQTENTKNSPTELAELVKYSDQNLFGEGLAIYNEITTRKITPSAFEIYYFRIKAVRMLSKSFREIYSTLSEVLNPQRAFVMTYRIKRGMADTSFPGGFPKDASYLLGFHEIETLIAEKYPKKLLYATKSPVLSTLLLKYGLINMKNIITPRFLK